MNDIATLIGFADAAAIAALILKRDIQRNLPAILAALQIKGR